MSTAIKVAKSIHDELGNVNRTTIHDNHRVQINEIDNVIEFILFNMNHYKAGYVSDLLLTFPDLLFKVSMDDWLEIIKLNTPREDVNRKSVFKKINDDGKFADLIFLSKYLKLDSVSILKRVLDINSEDFHRCLRFMKTYSYKFFISNDELNEDLNTFYNVKNTELQRITDVFLSNGFQKGFVTQDGLIKRINELI